MVAASDNRVKMNTEELITRLARDSKVTPAAAADQLESAVARIIKRLRRGNPVALPGIGVLERNDHSGIVLKPALPKPLKRAGGRRG